MNTEQQFDYYILSGTGENRIATPYNPHTLMRGISEECKIHNQKYFDFENWKQSHTFKAEGFPEGMRSVAREDVEIKEQFKSKVYGWKDILPFYDIKRDGYETRTVAIYSPKVYTPIEQEGKEEEKKGEDYFIEALSYTVGLYGLSKDVSEDLVSDVINLVKEKESSSSPQPSQEEKTAEEIVTIHKIKDNYSAYFDYSWNEFVRVSEASEEELIDQAIQFYKIQSIEAFKKDLINKLEDKICKENGALSSAYDEGIQEAIELIKNQPKQ